MQPHVLGAGDLRHHFSLEADVAVGHQHDLPLGVLAIAAQRLLERARHLGATVRPQLRKPLECFADVVGGCLHQAPREAANVVRELEQLEPVALLETVHQLADDALRQVERLAAHGPARVEQHGKVAVQGHRRHGRWHQRDQRVAAVVAGEAAALDDPRTDRVRRGRPAHDHVAVETLALAEADERTALGARCVDRVARRLRAATRGVCDREREAHACRRLAAIGAQLALVRNTAGRAVIANADHRGKAVLPVRRVVAPGRRRSEHELQRVQHVDRDLYLCARRHIAQLLLEGVRPRLLQQPRGAALEERIAVRLARLLARLHLGVDRLPANADRVAEHGAVGGQRQRVGQLERLVVGIRERLHQRGGGNATLGASDDPGLLERVRPAVHRDQRGGGDGLGLHDVSAHRDHSL